MTNSYYVESSEGKICYRVTFEGDSATCTCGDYSRGIKNDPNFKCKHIISVYNCIPAGEVQHGQLLERAKPKLNDRFIIKIENRDFVQYAGLLDLGHQKGISQIEVDPIQLPTQDNGNFAICKATVISKTGTPSRTSEMPTPTIAAQRSQSTFCALPALGRSPGH